MITWFSWLEKYSFLTMITTGSTQCRISSYFFTCLISFVLCQLLKEHAAISAWIEYFCSNKCIADNIITYLLQIFAENITLSSMAYMLQIFLSVGNWNESEQNSISVIQQIKSKQNVLWIISWKNFPGRNSSILHNYRTS